MLIDHAGLILFPEYTVFRMIGRLAFPIYAYCIAEGFFYTRNRLKYFLRLLTLGVICQIPYILAGHPLKLMIPITFSLSIAMMFFTNNAKCAFAGDKSSLSKFIEKLLNCDISSSADRIISISTLTLATATIYLLCYYVDVDYGFLGVMLPVFTSLFPDRTRRFFMFTAGLIALCIYYVYLGGTIQLFSLFAVPLIAMYNGNPGKVRMKYFFYVFYPAHLAILYLIAAII